MINSIPGHAGRSQVSTPPPHQTVYVILTSIVRKLVQECHDSEIIESHRHEGWDLATGFPVEGPKCKYYLGNIYLYLMPTEVLLLFLF